MFNLGMQNTPEILFIGNSMVTHTLSAFSTVTPRGGHNNNNKSFITVHN